MQVMAMHYSLQFIGYVRYHIVPVAWRFLPKQPDTGVPGRAAGVQPPAPVRHAGNQNPDRFSHRASQMRDCTIDRDHQIKSGDDLCRVGKVFDCRAVADKPEALAILCNL